MKPTKKCKACECIYPATVEFFNRSGKYLRSVCKQCDCKAVAKWRAKRLEQLKVLRPAYFRYLERKMRRIHAA